MFQEDIGDDEATAFYDRGAMGDLTDASAHAVLEPANSQTTDSGRPLDAHALFDDVEGARQGADPLPIRTHSTQPAAASREPAPPAWTTARFWVATSTGLGMAAATAWLLFS